MGKKRNTIKYKIVIMSIFIVILTGCSAGKKATGQIKKNNEIDNLLNEAGNEADDNKSEDVTEEKTEIASEANVNATEEENYMYFNLEELGDDFPKAPRDEEGKVYYDKIIFDVSELDKTETYLSVYDMMLYPRNYTGNVVRVAGEYYSTLYKDKDYVYVLIKDAAQCCSTGFEFEWDGDYVYPDDYPPENTEITVTGIFDIYRDDESPAFHVILREAVVEW